MRSFKPAIATALFLPAMVGLAVQLATIEEPATRLLLLGLLLLAPEQAHMAGVDFRNIAAVQKQKQDPRLLPFHRLVKTTVLGQVAGFSLAAVGFAGWGTLIILGSLIRFNLLATIRLDPLAEQPVILQLPKERLTVLGLNGIAGSLSILWVLNIARIWSSAGILAIVGLYITTKLIAYSQSWRQKGQTSLTHTADAAEQHP